MKTGRFLPSGMHMCSYAFSEDELSTHINVDIGSARAPIFHPRKWEEALSNMFLLPLYTKTGHSLGLPRLYHLD
ncbi:hypothetical protein RB195_022663 [Necator americanus]|uniref:Uncharacterized protein n=1 Tax=Necator americanus TaxID=51031 RepID=A0ABR1EG31_NECAM